jgi:predicted PurR-regulated permease PerM
MPPVETDRTDPARLALIGIFILLVFYTLHFAASLLLPIHVALLVSFALAPVVRALRRVWIPDAAGAALVLGLLLLAVGWASQALVAPATEWVERAPASIARIERKLRSFRRPLEQVQEATRSVESLTTVSGDDGVPAVRVRDIGLSDVILSGTGTLAAAAVVTTVLLYFLLASREGLLGRLELVLPRAEAAQVAREAERGISRYLLTVTLINLGLGVATAVAMWLIGMPTPLLWGALAAVLNFVPFLGAMATTLVVAGVGLLSFPDPSYALVAPLVFAALTSIEGFFLTPALLGRRFTLSPLSVFLSLLVWSWLWGPAGALVAVPTLAVAKVVTEAVERLHPVARWIGA